MTITFLGTGASQGIPVIACTCAVCCSSDCKDKRLRSAIHVSVDGKSLLIDSGPDFRQQVLRAGIDQLDALLFTHEHKDHVAGMDDIRAFNFKQQAAIDVYARKEVICQLKQEYAYIFAQDKHPGIADVCVHTIENQPFSVMGIPVTPVEVWHHKLSIFGFRIKDFAYLTDVSQVEPQEVRKLVGSRVLVVSALRKEKHIAHFNLEQAVRFAQHVGATKTYITHISHQMGLHQEVMRELPPSIELAHDGLSIQLAP